MVNFKFIFVFILEKSYFEILFISKKIKNNQTGDSIKTRKTYLNSEKNLDFSDSRIVFNNFDVDEDMIDIYILYNGEKIKSKKAESINYHRINAKDIGITEDFKELNFEIVQNIKLSITIHILNKYRTRGRRFKEKIKYFNKNVENKKDENENTNKNVEKKKFEKKEKKR